MENNAGKLHVCFYDKCPAYKNICHQKPDVGCETFWNNLKRVVDTVVETEKKK